MAVGRHLLTAGTGMSKASVKALGAMGRVAPRLAAAIDWIQPSNHSTWGGPMNGQVERRAMVLDVLRRFEPEAVVETGTYRGATTAFFADTSGVDVYSVEVSPRCFAFAKWRVGAREGVHLYLDDSRRFLRKMAASSIIPKSRVLFYLDAHWKELPLAAELDAIRDAWQKAVVIIDDFQVPGDPGYGFDDWGGRDRLCEDQLPDSVAAWGRWYPSAPSAQETGSRRGCVVLTSPGVDLASPHLRAG